MCVSRTYRIRQPRSRASVRYTSGAQSGVDDSGLIIRADDVGETAFPGASHLHDVRSGIRHRHVGGIPGQAPRFHAADQANRHRAHGPTGCPLQFGSAGLRRTRSRLAWPAGSASVASGPASPFRSASYASTCVLPRDPPLRAILARSDIEHGHLTMFVEPLAQRVDRRSRWSYRPRSQRRQGFRHANRSHHARGKRQTPRWSAPRRSGRADRQ